VAVDISPEALRYAVKNAERYNLSDRIEFITADILESGAADRICKGRRFDAILSNPPYIPKNDIAGLAPELSFEPEAALDGGNDGLVFYRTVTERFKDALTDDGFILYEIGSGQSKDVSKIGEDNGFLTSISFDLSGHDRNVLLTRK
jgi:release factor glutamine methyltransferase